MDEFRLGIYQNSKEMFAVRNGPIINATNQFDGMLMVEIIAYDGSIEYIPLKLFEATSKLLSRKNYGKRIKRGAWQHNKTDKIYYVIDEGICDEVNVVKYMNANGECFIRQATEFVKKFTKVK